MGVELVDLRRELYQENQVRTVWGRLAYHWFAYTYRRLKQGCPLCPLLFMIYMAGLERKLEGTWLGFDLSYIEKGQVVQQRIAGLMYADDIVLIANDRIGMQGLMVICIEEAAHLGIPFT